VAKAVAVVFRRRRDATVDSVCVVDVSSWRDARAKRERKALQNKEIDGIMSMTGLRTTHAG
jgi:hypothetical protein